MIVKHLPIQLFNKDLGYILGDIESHMTPNHPYEDRDKITWAHETTHGINSLLRNKYYTTNKAINAFYVLEDRAYILEEPNTTISAIARTIPKELRGSVYQLYMVDQARSWNNTPLYIMDEWTAYSNGSFARIDLDIQNRAETVSHMMEMCCYSLFLLDKTADIKIDQFVYSMLWRNMEIFREDKTSRAKKYLKKMQNNNEVQRIMQKHFGDVIIPTFWDLNHEKDMLSQKL